MKVVKGLRTDIPLINKPNLSFGTVSTPTIPSVPTPTYTLPNSSSNIVTGGGVSTGGGSSAGVTAAAKAAEAAAAANAKIDAQYNARPNSDFNLAMDQSRVDQVIAAVAAKVEANRPDVTVNMGIVGDPEAAARTVVDVLNRSYGRGALGADALYFGS